MQEALLQFIWDNKLFDSNSFVTTDNESIQVINFGYKNTHAGPDFINAKIKIEDTIWVGNIEVHTKAGDWYVHGHDKNEQYNNVILHVVNKEDREIFRKSGEKIPAIELDLPQHLINEYSKLLSNQSWVKCEQILGDVPEIEKNIFLDSLLVERLKRKAENLYTILNNNNNNWETSLYIFLARQFGFKVNAYPFEKLAESIPLQCYSKIKNSQFQIEALLFGQAGFLTNDLDAPYALSLLKEYTFLKRKFQVNPIDKNLWKFLRLRPNNFPTIRIAQFANLIFHSQNLFSKILEINDIESLRKLFNIGVSDFWLEHYNFTKPSPPTKKKISEKTIDLFIINSIIPTLFVYGNERKLEELKDRALLFLEQIDAEKNIIVDQWKVRGFTAKNAYQSQALLELYNEYCSKGACLKCKIGRLHLLRCVRN